MRDLDAKVLEQLLDAVGAHLEAQDAAASLLVVGGAALSLRGWVPRTTHDVDVLALAHPRGSSVELAPPEFSEELQDAVVRVARDFNLSEDWLNAQVGAQWRTGLPDGTDREIEWRQFGRLRIGLAGRRTLLALKLFAAADHGPESVHVQDLLALGPTDEELAGVQRWVIEQDAGPEFARIVAEVVTHVRDRRTSR